MKYRIKTITRILPADLQTPVGIYLKVRDLFPQSALLESSDYIRLKIVFLLSAWNRWPIFR